MICIGLDLATIKTGCSVKENKDLVYYSDIYIASKNEPDFRKRIKYIGNEIESVIKKYSPDKIFIEDAPIIKNSSASMLLIMQGYILSIIDRHDVPFEFFQPSQWRKALGIVGNKGKEALKKEVVKQMTVDYVNKRFSLNLIYKKDSNKSDDNIADSIGIVCCGMLGDD